LGVELTRCDATRAGFHPTRSAAISFNDQTLGYAGELHPDTVEQFDLTGRVAVLEVDLEPLIVRPPRVQMRRVSTYPHVDFDLSFEVALDAAAGELLDATAGTSTLVENAEIFDDYRSERGERAVAIRYRLRAADRTLDADEIADVRQKMIDEAVAHKAKLRGSA
jgi:phenylalanyl-tRNA synthetase beta chain